MKKHTKEEMSKEEMLRHIESAENEVLLEITPEMAFEMGKRGDMSLYDLAGRKVALILLKFLRRRPYVDISAVSNWTDLQMVLDQEAREEIEKIGPSGFQMSWAIVNVKWVAE